MKNINLINEIIIIDKLNSLIGKFFFINYILVIINIKLIYKISHKINFV